MRRSATFARGSLATIAFVIACGPALAQPRVGTPASTEPADAQSSTATPSGLEDIVVTAQRRSESLQSVPVAVTAFNSAALANRQLATLSDVAISTPGLAVSNRNGIILPFLRSVGSTGTSVGTEASVTVYLDGVYFARLPGAFFSLNNLERVEVLKGPQGTLFGRNASGGVIQLVTKEPSYQPDAKATLSYGNLNTWEGSAYASFGLGDKAALSVSATGRKQNKGFGRNLTTGKRFVYSDNYLLSSKLLLEPGEGTRIVASGFYGWSDTSMLRNAFPGTTSGYSTDPRLPIPSTSRGFWDDNNDIDAHMIAKVLGGYLRVEQELSFARFTSISGYSRVREHFRQDLDYTERADSEVNLYTQTKQFTQEFQLGSLDSGGPLQWLTGLYYFNNKGDYRPGSFRGSVAPFGGVDTQGFQRSKSYAAYGQGSYEIVPSLSATVGVRYTHDKVSADGRFLSPTGAVLSDPPAASFKTKKWSYKFGIDYKPLSGILLYASYSRGFKEGNYPILFFNPLPSRPEVLDAYEIGYKTDLFGNRVRLNGAIFYYDLTDPQVQLIQNGAVFTENAGGSRVKGAEIEGTARLVDGLTLRGSVTYLDSKYTDFTNAPSAPPNPLPPYGTIRPVQSVDATGNITPYAAKWTVNLGFEYEIDTDVGAVNLGADYYHNSGIFFEPDNFLRQPAYDIVNGRVQFKPTVDVGVSIWGKNLTNEKYITNATANVGVTGYLYSPAPGRTYGVSLDLTF